MTPGRNLAVLLLAVVLASPALAWNPMIRSNGEPVTWSTPTVIWNPDGGGMGKLSNVQATQMLIDEIAKWQAVPTATIAFGQGVQIVDPTSGLPTDVTSANYVDVINADNGQNPIIFDDDREIFDYLGMPSGVVGFAGVLRTSGNSITKGYAVLQGDWFDDEPYGTAPSDPGEISESSFRAMLVHEFGHFIGLAHSSVNHEVSSLPGCPGPTVFQIETMSPYLVSEGLTLEHDDETGVSALYPTAAFQSSYATIRGQLIDRDGITPFDGANIVLRPDTTDCDARYDLAQSTQSGVLTATYGGPGWYAFFGLTPGDDYTLLATTINDGGSYRINPPATLGGPDDYYNGADEDWFDDVDDPTQSTPVTAPSAGATLDGFDIKINNPGGPGVVSPLPAGGLSLEKMDGGTPLPAETRILDDGAVNSASAFSGTSQAAWVNRFTPDPEEYPFRIERIDLMFWHGSVSVGRAIRLLVYHDPGGTGDPANATLLHGEDVTVQQLSTVDFNEYTLTSPVQIDAGDFYVGAYDLVADGTTNFIMSSDTDTQNGHAFYQADGTGPAGFFAASPDKTWMVRAHGSTVPAAGSVRLSWGSPCNSLAVPDQDFVVYRGNLSSLRVAADHQPLACGTGGAASHDVVDAGVEDYYLVAPVLADREGSLGTGTGGLDRTPVSSCRTVNADACP